MKIYAIDELYYKDNHAGYKARRDIYDILKKTFRISFSTTFITINFILRKIESKEFFLEY